MNKQSILYFIADSSQSGAPIQVLYLARSLSVEYELAVICPGGWLVNELKACGIKVHTFEGRLGRVALYRSVRDVLLVERPDLFHCHGVRAGIIGPAASQGLNIPVVYTEHLWTNEFHLANSVRQYLQITALIRAQRFITHTVAVSQAVATFLSDRIRVAPRRLSVIYGGIEPIAASAPVKEPIIGTLGTLAWVKGIDVLLEAIALLSPQHPHLSCRIAGDGPDKQSLQEKSLMLGVADRVEWCGQVDDVAAFYQSLQIYVQPSISESFGLAAVEAQSAAIAVVASSVGGLCEVIDGGETGLFSVPGDAAGLAYQLNILLSDAARRGTMATAGAQHARQFTIARMVDQYSRLYRELSVQ